MGAAVAPGGAFPAGGAPVSAPEGRGAFGALTIPKTQRMGAHDRMTEWIAANMDSVAASAPTWGFVIIFVLMAIESSFIPFPSEVVMIPAGFLACRGELTTGQPWVDLLLALAFGLAGSMAGAYVNYYLALWLGRPVLYRYGRYVGLSEAVLSRSEEIFNRYGEMTTIVCRMLPAIRQLISIPAGLCRMELVRFSVFTGLGAGVWCLVLLGAGWWLGRAAGDMTYPELVERGKELIQSHYGWLLAALAVAVAAYVAVKRLVMGGASRGTGGVAN